MRIRTSIVGLGVFLLCACLLGTQVKTIDVNVDLVQVNVTVTDSRGRFVQGLSKENFRVYEDKVEQQITHFSSEDAAVSLGVIYDRSGSMGDKKPKATDPIRQNLTWVYDCLKQSLREDEYFLIEFSDQARVTVDFTNDTSKVTQKLPYLGATGRTALWDAIYAGIKKVGDATNPRKALLVLTDGGENHSRYTFADLKGVVREADVRIYGIDHEEVLIYGLAQLADATGGAIFRSAAPCKELAADLRNQYVLGYRPTNSNKDDAFRNIQVRLDIKSLPKEMSNLTVRARKGYYAQ